MAEAEVVGADIADGANNVPLGFKMTELGPLPEHWSVKRIGEISAITARPRGLSIPSALNFIPMELIPEGTTATTPYRRIPASEFRSGVFCEPGDILVPKITPCFENGKLGIVPQGNGQPFFATTEVFPLKPIAGKVDRRFLFYLFMNRDLRYEIASKMEGTTGRQRVPKHVLLTHAVPLPPPDEQCAITCVLRTVQRAKEATEKVIATARELKKSLMRHLFTFGPVPILQTDKIAPKDTEIGSIPAHWDMMRLGKLVAEGPQNGIYKSLHFYGTGVEILRIDDFDNDGQFSSAPLAKVQIESSEQRKFTLRQGDILINRVNSLSHLGKSVLAEALHVGAVFESNMMRFRVDESRAVPDFVHRYLLHPSTRDALRGMATRAVAQSSINQGHVCSLQIPIPPISEQQQIVAFLSATDAKLRAEASRVQALDILFQALLRNLLNGTVRVLSGATATSNGDRL